MGEGPYPPPNEVHAGLQILRSGWIMADAVTASTLVTNSFKNIYDLLTDSSNGVTDPASRGLARTKWIMPSFPDEYGSDFPGYPIITIETDLNYETTVFGRGGREVNIPFSIMIFTKKSEHLDSITDDIQNILKTYESTTEGNGLFHPTMTNSVTTTNFRDKDKIHMRTLFITYRWFG